MNWLETLLSPALVRAVGYTILHSLWQGAVVALALGGLLLVLRRHSAQVRYRVTGVALGLVLLLAGVTFLRYYWAALPTAAPAAEATTVAATATGVASAAAGAAAAAEAANPLSRQAVLGYVEQHLPLLVGLWLLGMLTMTLRLLGGLAYVQRLRNYGTRSLGQTWQERLDELTVRAGLQRPVQLLESSLVRVPVVVGHLKPLILLPLGAVAGLSAGQLEAILAHEVAHIARRDYLINLLQSVAEVLFFYHPAVWFLTATLRSERENCCDDVAAELCGNPLVLARALAALAELGLERTAAPQLSLAATGPKGSLLGRVRRLVQGRTAPTFSEGFMAACVVMVGLLLLSFSAAAALANPHLAEAPRRLRDQVLRPFIREVVAPIAVRANVPEAWEVSSRPEQESLAPADGDDPKSKRKNKGSQQIVVVDGANHRGQPGTVIIEKDKKGRVTDMYVNGQRVETPTAGKSKDKVTQPTQIIRVGPSGQTYSYAGPGEFKFSYDFDQQFNSADFQRQMKKLEVDMRQLDKLKGMNFTWNGNGTDWQNIKRDALADAEKSLVKARASQDLSEDERDKIEEALDRIRDQREELREAEQERTEEMREAQRERAEALREAAEERREAQREAQRERMDAERDRIQVERDRVRAERDRVRAERDAQRAVAESSLIDELVKDGLIKDRNNFQMTLTNRSMTVNGQKKPEATAARYRKLYEEATGRSMKTDAALTLNHAGSSTTHTYSHTSSDRWDGDAPVPPVPPVPPVAPIAPVPPVPPVAPRAPRAPRASTVNGVNISDQLRRDGLIGANDRSYQLRLDASGMTVNGEKQPAATAARYRQLLGDGKGSKVNINISVNAD